MRLRAVALCLSAMVGPWAGASAQSVECETEYAIFGWRHVFVPDPDEPYAAATREVGQRFRLKVSWASVHARADTLVIDVQYWDGSQYTTMQHSTYGPDILAAARAANGTLGPEQWLYSPDLGRALRYQCQLSRAAP